MVSLKLASSALAVLASFTSLAKAQEDWGSFTGDVNTVNYISSQDYSLVSQLTISLNPGWSLADLQGRTSGQIANKSIAYNTADSKYYAKIGYTDTSANVTSTQVCFQPVPIQISLNQDVNGSSEGRIVNGYFFIGCVDKSQIVGLPTSSTSSSLSTVSTTSLASTSIATISSETSAATSSAPVTSSETEIPTTSASVASTLTSVASTSSTTKPSSSSSTLSTTEALTTSSTTKASTSSSTTEASTSSSDSTPPVVVVSGNTTATGIPQAQTNGVPVKSAASLVSLGAAVLALVVLA